MGVEFGMRGKWWSWTWGGVKPRGWSKIEANWVKRGWMVASKEAKGLVFGHMGYSMDLLDGGV